jgi:uncharacterized protein
MFLSEIAGGALIGLASALPLLWEGRIAGVSGYAATSLRLRSPEAKTSILFVLGLVLGSFVWRLFGGALPAPPSTNVNLFFWILAGLLVGFGSRLAGGCTSGHGVCGLGRMSPRSLVSVLVFMSFAIMTQFFVRGIR